MGIWVVNWAGEKEPFSWQKVFNSARRVGANEILAKEIADTIQKEVYSGIKTKVIFQRVLQLLNQKHPPASLAFNIKEGLRRLGPTGYPFEKYIARILEEEGYKVKINQIIKGFCTSYEIDFLAEKEGILYIGECKYHQLPGTKVDLTIALANYARFLDIQKGGFFKGNHQLKSLLVTNTKFSSQAITYSSCVGVELLGWKYPPSGGLETIIDRQKLYPITVFPEFSDYIVKTLFEENIILIKDLVEINIADFSKKRKITKEKLTRAVEKAKLLLTNNKL
ncbi:MAG: hypothetical protein ACPLKP_01870 [Microgenomates group bacterium]